MAFGADAMSFDNATRAFRYCADSATEMQDRMLGLWTRRMARDAEAMSKIARSRSVDTLWAAEVEWAQDAYDDLVAEGKHYSGRLVSALRDVTASR